MELNHQKLNKFNFKMSEIDNEIISNSNFRRKFTEFILMLSMFTTSFVFFRNPFEFYPHYIIFILYLPVFFIKYKIPKNITYILLILLLTGLINILTGNLDWFQLIKVWGGSFLSLNFYYFVFLYFEKNVLKIFNYYIKFCSLLLIIGLFQIIFFQIGFKPGYDFRIFFGLNKWSLVTDGGILGIKFSSFLTEPAQLAIVTIPVVFISLNNIFFNESNFINYKSLNYIFLILYVLITSATGFIGLLICLVIIAVRNKIYNIFLGLIPSIIILFVLYNNVSDFKIRVDAALELNKSFENDIQRDIANTSTFTLYDNYIVTYNNFLENPVIGSGIGSHQYAFDKFSLTKRYSNLNVFANNSKDANSLFLRIVSETGLLGLFFLFFLLFRGISTMNTLNKLEYIVSVSLLLIIILSLIRQGNYFLNGLPLIFILFYYNKNRSITKESI